MVRKIQTIPAGEFKAKCLSLLNEAANGRSWIITKRGKPVARLVPPQSTPPVNLKGTVLRYDRPTDPVFDQIGDEP